MSQVEEIEEVEEEISYVEVGIDDPVSLTIKRHVLLAMLDRAASVLPSRDAIPVLKNFQFQAVDGRLTVIATDLELSIISISELVDIKTEGTAVLPGKQLVSIVKEAAGETVSIEIEDDRVNLISENAHWTLRLIRDDEYPLLPDIKNLSYVEVDRLTFLESLEAVYRSASTDTNRPNLCLVDCAGGKVRATDGVRCQQVDMGEGSVPDMQIPIGAVQDLLRLMRATDVESISVADDDAYLVFKIGNDSFIASKLAMEFPPIEDLLINPAMQNDRPMTCDREELVSTIKRVRITADPESSAIRLTMDNNQLCIQSQDDMGNKADEIIPCGWSGSEYSVVVNHRFLTDLLEISDAPTCHFYFGKDTKTNKSHILHRDPDTSQIGIIGQMRADWALAS